jgi:serine/threonine protein kinase
MHRMMDGLLRALAWLMICVRVNQIQRDVQDGLPVFIKRRRLGGSIAIWVGNLFLALAQSPARMFVRSEEWMDWEVQCACLLYPDRPPVKKGVGALVIVPEVCGISLRQLIRRNNATTHAFTAAARELKRVHQISCDYYQGAWSHGDLHHDNILFDGDSDRAVLIDFDTRHDFRISRIQRQSDDLKLLLLELVELPDERWYPFASALIETYGDPAILNQLSSQLWVPRGFARILWHTQARVALTPQIKTRLETLRNMIRQVAVEPAFSGRTQVPL